MTLIYIRKWSNISSFLFFDKQKKKQSKTMSINNVRNYALRFDTDKIIYNLLTLKFEHLLIRKFNKMF